VFEKGPGQIPSQIELIARTDDARTDLEQRLEDAYNAELLELAMDCVKQRVKSATLQAFPLTVTDRDASGLIQSVNSLQPAESSCDSPLPCPATASSARIMIMDDDQVGRKNYASRSRQSVGLASLDPPYDGAIRLAPPPRPSPA
jgi:hypothetical protein